MLTLSQTLHNNDPALLPILAKPWGAKIDELDTDEAITALAHTMLTPERAEKVWQSLDDAQRGALQMLIASGSKMPMPKFERLFGEIRQMGAARIEREKPHIEPASVAEALFYRGLIAQAFEQAEAGPRAVIYVPEDLAQVLPTHKTAYEKLESAEEEPAVEPLEEVESIQQANTYIVDDLTTLLAYLQLHGAGLEGEGLAPKDRDALMPFLLLRDERRLAFLLGLGLSAGLIELQGGRAHPKRADVRRWLEASRASQVRQLAEAWHSSTVYLDLWHVPGLHPEPTGWTYDPAGARAAFVGFLEELVPPQSWWSVSEFIAAVKEADPDFQRPGGDYENWFIRDDQGEYLHGFESWDAVEGALLTFYLAGPMHWLGLLDLAPDAARLTAYGRAFVGLASWPMPPDPEEKIVLQPDGILLVSRKMPRIDRFQVARFTSWVSAGDPYQYRLDAQGVAQAADQGINTGHIAGFISRMLGDAPLPATITRLLESWRSGPAASVTLERLLVLRTSAPETLDYIMETPALRRYLGAQLGPMAVVVRADQWDALRDALGERGIEVELVES